ncbi:bacterial leucyl aminopeptidase [Tenacibaculum sp. 190524A02b]|uniref:Bacterial leucyl aminopeptidase n=1 Tax=Tenacibaculum vairaonense TaxID=3137860 RepID=A0ABM9PMQ8_9FLAO
MKKKYFFITLLLLCLNFSTIYSQQKEMFYGTIETKDAVKLKKLSPQDIMILSSSNGYSAVKLSEDAAEKLHHMILTHGPGFIYENSKEDAIKTINALQNRRKGQKRGSFSINQDQVVKQHINLVNNINIANHIKELEGYGTRYHTTQSAKQSVLDLKQKWESMAANRNDVSVRIVNHNSSSMPSVVMTITGSEKPDEFVIIGGHIDSISPERTTNAPGADDNASGIATITEVARVLLSTNFKPKRTIEFMAFAAEEIGLRGSKEIAQDYKSRNVNVLAYVQFDMTNYKGSSNDVYVSDDSYNSSSLNAFLVQLMDHYNASGTHKFTYGYTRCNYGCSDHYSWAQQGYETAFPFEATFNGSSPYIHTVNDTSSRFPTANATHAAKFAKLGLEFLIEVAKSQGTSEPVTYCAAKGNNVSDEYIQKVAIGSINNSSTAQTGYQDFTSLSTDLQLGSPQTITITPKWTGRKYNEAYRVWIDYNQDGDFEDNGEQVYSKGANQDASVSGTFTVPPSAKSGKTRMRVTMRYNTLPSSCGSFNYGEVEDYSVNLTNGNNIKNNSCNAPIYNPSVNYSSGDKTLYNNIIYERTNRGWNRLSVCYNPRARTNTHKVLVNDNEVVLFASNPVKGNQLLLYINNELWQNNAVIINDMNGKTVAKVEMSSEKNTIDVSNINAGIYFISLENTGKRYTQKLIKN